MLRLLPLPFIAVCIASSAAFNDPEVTMGVGEMIRHWGYPMERHDVETSDGFVLELFRIPHGRKVTPSTDNSTTCRPAILFVHGFSADGSQYVWNPPETSAGYVFADSGFDVFIANVRGTPHGKNHRTLRFSEAKFNAKSDYPLSHHIRRFGKTSDRAFWDFSVDEHTHIDLPAIIDKALSISGQKSLIYVGHSQGATIGLSLLSSHAEYNQKVRAFFGWGAISTTAQARGAIGAIVHYCQVLKPLTQMYLGLLGSHEFMPNWTTLFATIGSVCVPEHMHDMCRGLMSMLQGPSTAPFNMTRMPVYLSHFPAGTSVKAVVHHGQNALALEANGKFDYGFWNTQRYGKNRPPTYDYAKVDSPVYFYSSPNDYFGPANETQALIARLRPDVFKEAFEIPSYGHVDFTVALDAPEKVLRPMIDIINRKYPGCQ